VGVMELGALVCTAARPHCAACPLARDCSWRRAGRPPAAERPAGQRYEGTDRQCRGRLLTVLRDAEGPVTVGQLDVVWPVPVQRARALDGLVADGLVDVLPNGEYSLPGWPGGTTPRNPPLRSAPRCGNSPTHRPLTGPEARFAGPV
jgi:A/G-specific adenine glycosylase